MIAPGRPVVLLPSWEAAVPCGTCRRSVHSVDVVFMSLELLKAA